MAERRFRRKAEMALSSLPCAAFAAVVDRGARRELHRPAMSVLLRNARSQWLTQRGMIGLIHSLGAFCPARPRMEIALDGQTVLGIAIAFATLAGPVLAVLITRYVDDSRRVRERRLDVFRSLMTTRRAILAPDRVRALNLVEIEFYGVKPVEDAHQQVMAHINAPRPLPAGWDDRQRKLMTKLLSEMAKVLGYDLQQLDVLEGGYYPQGIADIELEQQAARRALVEVLSGNRPLIISPAAPAPPAPFPPPPPPSALPGTEK